MPSKERWPSAGLPATVWFTTRVLRDARARRVAHRSGIAELSVPPYGDHPGREDLDGLVEGAADAAQQPDGAVEPHAALEDGDQLAVLVQHPAVAPPRSWVHTPGCAGGGGHSTGGSGGSGSRPLELVERGPGPFEAVGADGERLVEQLRDVVHHVHAVARTLRYCSTDSSAAWSASFAER